jgi:Tol biopolymer transport system component
MGGFFPVWMPDGRHLIFSQGGVGAFWQRTDGVGTAEKLGIIGLGSGVTPDGKLIYSPAAKDVMAMALDTRRVETILQTPATERNAVVSPNGRWLAYESDSSEQFEIYVAPYPNVRDAARRTISAAGGTRPAWSRSGDELFYVAPGGALMAVRVDTRSEAFIAAAPVKVVEGPYATGAPVTGRNYDVSTDGKRFLMVKEPPTSQAAAQIVIVQHWFEELTRLAPSTPR